MNPSPLLLAAVLFAAGSAVAAQGAAHLQPFASEKAFQDHLAKLKAKEAEARRKAQSKNAEYAYDTPMPTAVPAPPAAAANPLAPIFWEAPWQNLCLSMR